MSQNTDQEQFLEEVLKTFKECTWEIRSSLQKINKTCQKLDDRFELQSLRITHDGFELRDLRIAQIDLLRRIRDQLNYASIRGLNKFSPSEEVYFNTNPIYNRGMKAIDDLRRRPSPSQF